MRSFTGEALEHFDSQLGDVVVPDTSWETGPARGQLERDVAAHVHAARCVTAGEAERRDKGVVAWSRCQRMARNTLLAFWPWCSALAVALPCRSRLLRHCRLEHVGEALAAAQKAAAKAVSAAAISLLEAPPADLWLRLTAVSWRGLPRSLPGTLGSDCRPLGGARMGAAPARDERSACVNIALCGSRTHV